MGQVCIWCGNCLLDQDYLSQKVSQRLMVAEYGPRIMKTILMEIEELPFTVILPITKQGGAKLDK